MSRLPIIIAALAGISIVALFGFVAAAAYSASLQQCPGESDCEDAHFATILATIMVALGILLTVPAILALLRLFRR
jgi:hypothetical protein